MQSWDARPGAFQILGRAIQSLWQIVISAPLLLPTTIAVYALVSIGLSQLSNLLPISLAEAFSRANAGEPIRLPFASAAPVLLLQLGEFAIMASILALPCIIISRRILLDETDFLVPSPPIVWRYTAWSFMLGALPLAAGQVQYLSDAWWTSLIPTIVGFAVFIPFSLAFPDIAIGINCGSIWGRARNSMRHLRGNFWLLLRAYLILFASTIVTVWLPYLPTLLFYQDPIEITPTSWTAQGFEAAIMAILGLVTAAILAWLYAWAVPSSQWLDNFD